MNEEDRERKQRQDKEREREKERERLKGTTFDPELHDMGGDIGPASMGRSSTEAGDRPDSGDASRP
ncbi:hypothetical protein [Streptosporangium carneum]|uniref:Uncharacterized protein n=1 Tax=Streptosporangium carneum TaxID=47481 RepID=A0A9W6HYR7_9ACTN|nr:hypothetical protein [Streptosporangium carneum]GLK08048.1 hypothetical protein GCM10017600_14530 [Streptosporangium carneum]